MLSLTQSIKTIGEAEASRRAAAQELSAAAEAAAQYAVEVDPRTAARFREQLRTLAESLARPHSDDTLQAARQDFQTELREYAARAGDDIRGLKQDLNAAAEAMQSFAQGIGTSSHDHEALLNREFQRLTSVASSADLAVIRSAIHDAVSTVTASYGELRQAHNLVVAQLRDEIRILQQSVERQHRTPANPGPANPGLLDKRSMDQLLEKRLRSQQPFLLLLAKPDFPPGQAVPQPVREHAVAEFVKTLGSLAGSAPLAVWPPAAYAVLLPSSFADSPAWTQQLTACHLFQLDRLPRTLRIDPSLQTVEFTAGDSPSLFFSRLSQATENLGC